MTPEQRAELRRLCDAASNSDYISEESRSFLFAASTALPALLDYVETLEGEIARWRACCEVGVTDPDYKLTITIEATAPAAAHGFCGKGSTVAEAVRSLGEMMKGKQNETSQ